MNRPSYQVEIAKINKRIRELQKRLTIINRAVDSTSEGLRTGRYEGQHHDIMLRINDLCFVKKRDLEVEIAELEDRVMFHWG